MELFNVQPARLAHAVDVAPRQTRAWVYALVAVIAIRALAAALLPLSFDEAYYWLWSRHLAAGYYDHPPMIAWAIRAGTLIAGNTVAGIRLIPFLLSLCATWAVWRSAIEWTGKRQAGIFAALAFNLMLMTTAEMLSATPDAPLMAFASLFLLALVRLERSGEARWWIAAGVAGGFALLSKYTALFLGAGAFVYLLGSPSGRRWSLTPWPYAGALLAFLIFAPDIWWNAQHDWVSYRFQFGKAASHHIAPLYLIEFVAGQIILASPLILILAIAGMADLRRNRLFLFLAVPAVLFFLSHALQARVQGNWPSFLYPVLAVAAAAATIEVREPFLCWCRKWALPGAAALLAVLYAQAFFSILPMRDPIGHLLAVGFRPVAKEIGDLAHDNHAGAIVTTGYADTGWIAFYGDGRRPVIQWNENQRWLEVPEPSAAALAQPLLYVTEARRGPSSDIAHSFGIMRKLATLERRRGKLILSRYDVYLIDGWHGPARGRIVN